ncbi:MAG: hypothetical protein WBF79_08765 [Rhodococcus sp. (in: high G+C Gram-positive bacteria)]
MAIDPDDHDHDPDPLMDRAARELREEETPSWAKASTAIMSALRATTRRTRMLDASFPDDGSTSAGDSLLVADQVVKLGIVRASADLPCTIRGIDLDIDERDVTGLTLEIAVTYGEDMRALALAVADRAAASVNSDLGDTVGERDVSVSIVDVSLP